MVIIVLQFNTFFHIELQASAYLYEVPHKCYYYKEKERPTNLIRKFIGSVSLDFQIKFMSRNMCENTLPASKLIRKCNRFGATMMIFQFSSKNSSKKYLSSELNVITGSRYTQTRRANMQPQRALNPHTRGSCMSRSNS